MTIYSCPMCGDPAYGDGGPCEDCLDREHEEALIENSEDDYREEALDRAYHREMERRAGCYGWDELEETD